MSDGEILGRVRLILGLSIAAFGLAIVVVGSLAHLRLPDIYTRAHGVALSDGVGAALMAFGFAVAAPDVGIASRLLILAGLLAGLNRAFSHVSVAAAHWGGLTPSTEVKRRNVRK